MSKSESVRVFLSSVYSASAVHPLRVNTYTDESTMRAPSLSEKQSIEGL